MAELPGGELHLWTHLQKVVATGRDPGQGLGGEHKPGGPCAKAFNPRSCIPRRSRRVNRVLAAPGAAACESNWDGWKDLGSVLFALFISYKCNYQGIN